eukprot:scaffold52448_cov60-Phaeocystis_antarctica.AAC.2
MAAYSPLTRAGVKHVTLSVREFTSGMHPLSVQPQHRIVEASVPPRREVGLLVPRWVQEAQRLIRSPRRLELASGWRTAYGAALEVRQRHEDARAVVERHGRSRARLMRRRHLV